ncbi:MAG: hypothetical protein KC777_10805 [Cyanobacteria bacterium HKST-UBA02]|nr:hypothetical protein [Cyanobacteria bacterium HKST-UBA02]
MNDTKLLQTFAIDQAGLVVSVRDVERGKACNCACPACGEVLIARQGEIRSWHFAHESGAECEGGTETALHLAAKQIVASAPQILIPGFEITGEVSDGNGSNERAAISIEPQYQKISKTTLELPSRTPLGLVVPDITIGTDDGVIFVEIAVTHFVDARKAEKLQSADQSSMEIDIDPSREEEWSWSALQSEVLDNAYNRRWINYAKTEELANAAKKLAEEKLLSRLSATAKTYKEIRYLLKSVPVRLRKHDWGVTVWAGWDDETNPVIRGMARRFGGRWNKRYKNWSYSPGLFSAIEQHLNDVGAILDTPHLNT